MSVYVYVSVPVSVYVYVSVPVSVSVYVSVLVRCGILVRQFVPVTPELFAAPRGAIETRFAAVASLRARVVMVMVAVVMVMDDSVGQS